MISSTWRRASAALVAFAFAGLPALAIAAPLSSGDIRDIRGPIAIPPWWHWPLAVAFAAVAALGVTLFVRWWRARRPAALTPLERARRALAIAETHAHEGRSRAWAEIVAETTRGALAARLGTEVLPQTTSELSSASWTKPPASEELDATRLLALLETCDLARFAKANLGSDSLLVSTALARELTERLFAPPPARAPVKAAALSETVPS
jgi:hypothetical protein